MSMKNIHVVIITLFVVWTSSVALGLDCFACENVETYCNETHCFSDYCGNSTSCAGSCLILAKLKQEGYLMDASCLPQVNIGKAYGERDRSSECMQAKEPNYIEEENYSTISCLCQADYCNSHIVRLELEVPGTTEATDDAEDALVPVYIACSVVFALVLIAVLVCLRIIVHRKKLEDEEEEKQAMAKAGQNRFSADSSSLEGVWDDGKHSYSTYKYSNSVSSHYSRGSKGNALNQNDQHLPIELDVTIGRGRFADVWKAKLQQETDGSKVISVKVFRLPNYGAWRQEKEILSEKWMKHDNIIEYFASEQHSSRGRLQYWLITAYYSKGNLQEFLRNNSLKWNEFCDMAASIARGLSYLHDEHDLEGNEKLPVAHRDVKSCNILVKDDGVTCVLADFGLSLKLDPSLSHDELANAGQVGTSRYMAPELLERLVNLADIQMFKRVDMYAFSLVMWELASRCDVIEGMLRPYQPPFGDRIADHPTKEQILLLVCRSKQRPEIRSEWRNHSGLAKYIETMQECWDSEPEARLTASCALERILAIRNDDCVTEIPLSPKEAEALKKEALADNEVNEITELISTVV